MASNIWRSLPRLARLSSEFVNGTSYLKSPAALLRIARLVSSATKSSSSAVSASVSPVSEKTPYEIELERLQGQDKRRGGDDYYGFFEDEPVLDKVMFHGIMFVGVSCFCAFTVIMCCYTPMFKGDDKRWKYREARWLMRERREKGLPMISADYAPPELLESMVPPAGEWEREWLSNQPTTKPLCTDWFGQNFTF